MSEMVLRAVGIVRSDIIEPSLVARSGDLDWGGNTGASSHRNEHVSDILIDPLYADIVEGIEDFSHLLVLYWAHLVDEEARSFKRVHPMGRKDMPLVGVFSTCSPARPNPVLLIDRRQAARTKRDNPSRVRVGRGGREPCSGYQALSPPLLFSCGCQAQRMDESASRRAGTGLKDKTIRFYGHEGSFPLKGKWEFAAFFL